MANPRLPLRPLRRAYAACAVAFVALFLAWIRAGWGGPFATRAFVDLSSTLIPLGAGALALARCRFLPAPRRLPWRLLGAACLGWGLGNLAWTWYELVEKAEVPFPSLADVGYLAFIPLVGLALLAMLSGTRRLLTLLDGMLIGSALLFTAWALFLRPLVAYAGQQEGVLAKAVSLAYPLGDLVLLAILLLVASRAQAGLRRTLTWMVAALALFTVADMGFWYQTALGTYQSGAWTDVGWVAGFLLVGYAAIRPVPALPEGRAPAGSGALSVALPLVPFLLAMAVALRVELAEGGLEPFLFWSAATIVFLLVTRQLVLLVEVLRLRRQAEGALAGLQEAQRVRSLMLNNVTHDLLGPLSPIRLQVKAMGLHLDEPQRVAHGLAIIERNAVQMHRLAQDLKDLANLEEGRLKVDLAPRDLVPLLRAAVASHQAAAWEAKVTLSWDAPGALSVRGDAARLNQVVDNLLSNAVRFTPEGGRVHLAAGADAAHAWVRVTDTGRGLTPEEVGRLFQPFSQVHQRHEAKLRGTGLGLFISKGIVQQHGGAITASSPGRGKGATFEVRLPLAEAPGGAAAARGGS